MIKISKRFSKYDLTVFHRRTSLFKLNSVHDVRHAHLDGTAIMLGKSFSFIFIFWARLILDHVAREYPYFINSQSHDFIFLLSFFHSSWSHTIQLLILLSPKCRCNPIVHQPAHPPLSVINARTHWMSPTQVPRWKPSIWAMSRYFRPSVC